MAVLKRERAKAALQPRVRYGEDSRHGGLSRDNVGGTRGGRRGLESTHDDSVASLAFQGGNSFFAIEELEREARHDGMGLGGNRP